MKFTTVGQKTEAANGQTPPEPSPGRDEVLLDLLVELKGMIAGNNEALASLNSHIKEMREQQAAAPAVAEPEAPATPPESPPPDKPPDE